MTHDELKAAAERVQAELRELDSRFVGSGVSPTYVTTEFSTLNALADFAAAMLDGEPLSLDVLRRELGEPTFASNLVTQWGEYEDKSQVSLRRSGNVFVRGQRVLTAGQLRRIISVIRETAAGGEG